MGFIAVRVDPEKIEKAEKLLKRKIQGIPTEYIKRLTFAIDKVMGEAGLYSEDLAALAIRQSLGDLIEASFMLRSFKNTIRRIGYSEPSDCREMRVIRRISSAFKDIPGGQILGATRDYSLRLLDDSCDIENEEGEKEVISEEHKVTFDGKLPKVKDYLKDYLETIDEENTKESLYDITKEPLIFPNPPRSAVLQSLTMGEEGALLMLAYSSLRGYGPVHPTILELRQGYLPIKIKHPVTGKVVRVGEIRATECEVISQEKEKLKIGYGLVFGFNERKAISMAILDRCLQVKDGTPASDEEFVLYHIDGVDAMGFVEHLKLPHYIFFASIIDRIKKVNK